MASLITQQDTTTTATTSTTATTTATTTASTACSSWSSITYVLLRRNIIARMKRNSTKRIKNKLNPNLQHPLSLTSYDSSYSCSISSLPQNFMSIAIDIKTNTLSIDPNSNIFISNPSALDIKSPPSIDDSSDISLALSFAAQRFANMFPPDIKLNIDRSPFSSFTSPLSMIKSWKFELPDSSHASVCKLGQCENDNITYLMPDVTISPDGKRIFSQSKLLKNNLNNLHYSNSHYVDDICFVTNYPFFNPRISTSLPASLRDLHYLEIYIVEGNTGNLALGVAAKPCPSFMIAGHSINSVSYDGATGKKCKDGQIQDYSQPFGPGDIIGMGYLVHSGTVFFTVNGLLQNTAFTGIRPLYPCISVSNGHASIIVNFGEGQEDLSLADTATMTRNLNLNEISKQNINEMIFPRRNSAPLKYNGNIEKKFQSSNGNGNMGEIISPPNPVYSPTRWRNNTVSVPISHSRQGWFKFTGAWGFSVAGWKDDNQQELKQQRLKVLEEQLSQLSGNF